MAKRTELDVAQRTEAALALLRREEPTAKQGPWSFNPKPLMPAHPGSRLSPIHLCLLPSPQRQCLSPLLQTEAEGFVVWQDDVEDARRETVHSAWQRLCGPRPRAFWAQPKIQPLTASGR